MSTIQSVGNLLHLRRSPNVDFLTARLEGRKPSLLFFRKTSLLGFQLDEHRRIVACQTQVRETSVPLDGCTPLARTVQSGTGVHDQPARHFRQRHDCFLELRFGHRRILDVERICVFRDERASTSGVELAPSSRTKERFFVRRPRLVSAKPNYKTSDISNPL